MRNQYVVLLTLLALGLGYGAYSLVFNSSEAADLLGHASAKALSSSPIPTTSSVVKQPSGFVPEERISLSKSNTITFRDVVGPLSVANAQLELIKKDKALKKGEPLYLVLDTPGGDITAGMQLIDTAKSLSRPVHTITNFAASMGFAFVQQLGKRYITSSGTLMAHRARVEGVGGQIPGEFLTQVSRIYRVITRLEMKNAARLGMSFQDYTATVKDEKWYEGADEAVTEGAADAQAIISCDNSLSGKSQSSFNTFFGPVKVTFADCPAITAPLAVSFTGSITLDEQRQYEQNVGKLRRLLVNGR